METRGTSSQPPLWWFSGEALPTMPGRELRILVADDEAIIWLALQDELARRGHWIMVAFDGQEALEIAAESAPIDVLVTDVRMPRVPGHQLALRMREMMPGLVVVLLSGDLDPRAVSTVIGAVGNVLTLRKPIDPDVIADAVEAFAANAEDGRAPSRNSPGRAARDPPSD